MKILFRIILKLSISPPQVQMQGSWGKDVIDCCWDEDGNVCAELPPLQPGLQHYNFLINGSQVIIANKFPFLHQLCSVL